MGNRDQYARWVRRGTNGSGPPMRVVFWYAVMAFYDRKPYRNAQHEGRSEYEQFGITKTQMKDWQ